MTQLALYGLLSEPVLVLQAAKVRAVVNRMIWLRNELMGLF